MHTHAALLDEHLLPLIFLYLAAPCIKTFAAAACVCSTWREASLRCRQLVARLQLAAEADSNSACSWLAGYLPCISELQVGPLAPGHECVALPGVLQALLHAASTTRAGSPPPAGEQLYLAAAVPRPASCLQVQLHTLKLDCAGLSNPALADLLAAGRALTSLRRLSLSSLRTTTKFLKGGRNQVVPHFTALKALTQLTALELEGQLGTPDALHPVLPCQLLQLSWVCPTSPWLTREAWCHLTVLTRLHVSCGQLWDEHGLLEPPALQQLSLCCTEAEGESLKVLQDKLVALALQSYDDGVRHLQCVTRLTCLEVLTLTFNEVEPALRQLPDLRRLGVSWPTDCVVRAAGRAASWRAMTQHLTALQLHLRPPSSSTSNGGASASGSGSLGWPIKHLQRLEELIITQPGMLVDQEGEEQPADQAVPMPSAWTVQLSQLSGLKRLQLPVEGAITGVHGWVSHLRGLTWLGLEHGPRHCGVDYSAEQQEQAGSSRPSADQEEAATLANHLRSCHQLQEVELLPLRGLEVAEYSRLALVYQPVLQKELPAAYVYIGRQDGL